MSATGLKFESPLYKVFEPGYHPQKPIIVDEAIESPETVTLRYEEEAARANGGDLRGRESPTCLLPMSAFKAQPPQVHGFADSPYSQYSPSSFPSHPQPTDAATTHLNQLAFTANNVATQQYMSAEPSVAAACPDLNVLFCRPGEGGTGTKVAVKFSSQYDFTSVGSPAPYASVSFGSQRCPAVMTKDGQNAGGHYTFTVSVDAPAFMTTACTSQHSVPLGLLVEDANGDELARAENVGAFTYHDAAVTPTHVGVGNTSPVHGDVGVITRKSSRSPDRHDSPPQNIRPNIPSPADSSQQQNVIIGSAGTNTFAFPQAVNDAAAAQAQAQAQSQVQNNFAAAAAAAVGYTSGTEGDGTMIGAYRGASFTDHYSRPSSLRSPHGGVAWNPYTSHVSTVRSPATSIPPPLSHSHTTITRPTIDPLPRHPGAPQLVRTSTLSHANGTGGGLGGGSAYSPFSVYPNRAALKINGDLESMAKNWSQEEWDNKRRIVQFKKSQSGSHLFTTFKAISVNDRPPNSICVSCIWWAEKQECFVTSVDTIALLEQLVAAPARFTVEEKNRIRRNLEGFHPLTVSKAKAESEEFFKVIMGFGAPKPRNIEKDVKVFPWKILGPALKKIIGKYSASASSTVPPSTPTHLLTPISISGAYPTLPPTPGSATTATDHVTASGYVGSAHHQSHTTHGLASPRATPTWTYSSAQSRTMSPTTLKSSSPIAPAHSSSGLRISTLSGPYMGDTRTTSPYALPVSQHSPHHVAAYSHAVPVSQSHHSRSWDGYPSGISDGYSTHAPGSHVYGSSAYGDGAQRA